MAQVRHIRRCTATSRLFWGDADDAVSESTRLGARTGDRFQHLSGALDGKFLCETRWSKVKTKIGQAPEQVH